jgi:hypothetical protein
MAYINNLDPLNNHASQAIEAFCLVREVIFDFHLAASYFYI